MGGFIRRRTCAAPMRGGKGPVQPAILVSLMSVPSCLEVEDAALVSGS